MARRRKIAVALPDVPEPLRDLEHWVWRDPVQVADMAAAYGLELELRLGHTIETAPWWMLFDTFRTAYGLQAGLVSETWPDRLDHNKLREAGVCTTSMARYRLATA